MKRIDADRVDADKERQRRQDWQMPRAKSNERSAGLVWNAEAATRRCQPSAAQRLIKLPLTAQQQQQNAQAESDRNRAAAAGRQSSRRGTLNRAKETRRRNRSETELAAADSDQQLQQAVRDREELRAKLLQQFNAILCHSRHRSWSHREPVGRIV